MKSRLNILLSSAGRRGALVRDFRKAARELNINLQIAVTDMTSLSVAYQMADTAETAPRVTEPGYTDWLLDLCKRRNIDLVFPLIDPELPILSAARDMFEANGICVAISGQKTMAISNDKRNTEQFFNSLGLATPRILQKSAVEAGSHPFPVFIKPSNGSSSIGSRILESEEDLRYWWPRTNDPLLMEYAPGREYTVDVYCGLNGDISCAVPRRRLRVRHGEVEKGRTENVSMLIEQAIIAAKALDTPRGVINFQCMVGDDNIPKWIELNARFGGGAPLSHQAGANFPKWLLEEALGLQPSIDNPAFQPGVTMMRWDDSVFAYSEPGSDI
jgi:carbamoyl-phosphate synthase large subunit